MGKQYITTAAIGLAHKSDIFDVAVCDRYTITCSSDGFLKFWDNKIEVTEEASKAIFVDKLGLHHISAIEKVRDGSSVVIIATVAFTGRCYLYQYDSQTDEVTKLDSNLPTELSSPKISFWAPNLHIDIADETIYFAATTAVGATYVFKINVPEEGELQLVYTGKTDTNDTSFATAIGIGSGSAIAVGHQNGNVYLYDLKSLRLIYTFPSLGVRLDQDDTGSSLSTVRKAIFSPDCKLMAVARDSGAYGIVALYDVKYGETIGTLSVPTHSSNVSVGGYTHEGWCLAIDFNEGGTLLATAGYDDKVRIWNVDTRERESTITISRTDVADEAVDQEDQSDNLVTSSLKFLKKGVRTGAGTDTNEGLVVVGLDRAIRWYREAGGI
ncbi:unnamed protein product [Kuraishia capsulata CBS 1993]|uniref:Uncharacterized protein n=1 Tax=Kuraishia capsulata CBS 1993 TaxID=1382522 RepID=W6MLK8_9ASCO|nr:uncharacterized protein KUCA_T00001697001 [Kuraishia capsulata CBS 1993]CDK25727.1 unnamed protein product [Kuraishia capsulata CBS 1993]